MTTIIITTRTILSTNSFYRSLTDQRVTVQSSLRILLTAALYSCYTPRYIRSSAAVSLVHFLRSYWYKLLTVWVWHDGAWIQYNTIGLLVAMASRRPAFGGGDRSKFVFVTAYGYTDMHNCVSTADTQFNQLTSRQCRSIDSLRMLTDINGRGLLRLSRWPLVYINISRTLHQSDVHRQRTWKVIRLNIFLTIRLVISRTTFTTFANDV